MRNRHAGAAKVTKSTKALDRITDRFYAEGQIDEVQPKLLECGVVNGGGE